MKNVEIYTDGACSGNPGPGGYAAILRYVDKNNEEHVSEIIGYETSSTNNRMELRAVIESLKKLKYPVKVKIYSDSKYVVDAFNKGWIFKWIKNKFSGRKNSDLWKELSKLVYDDLSEYSIEFIWVKGHAENEFNNRVDELAVMAYKCLIESK